jgi:hypothetical protein
MNMRDVFWNICKEIKYSYNVFIVISWWVNLIFHIHIIRCKQLLHDGMIKYAVCTLLKWLHVVTWLSEATDASEVKILWNIIRAL